MSELLSVKIKVGPTGHVASVVVDGKEMASYVRGFAVRSDVNNVTSVQLDFVKVEVDLEGYADLSAMSNEWATYRLGQVLRDEMQREAKA